jgi:hypothetical protein
MDKVQKLSSNECYIPSSKPFTKYLREVSNNDKIAGTKKKNTVYWDVIICEPYENRRFGERSPSINRVTRVGELGANL